MATADPSFVTHNVTDPDDTESSLQRESPEGCESSATEELVMENYSKQTSRWPPRGQHILAQFDDKSVVVYQAFNSSIAEYAVEHQRFGGPKYSVKRMTWIKTNFMWMMYRSGWAKKPDQERVLAIRITREGFDDILSRASRAQRQKAAGPETQDGDVLLQWDPDHGPEGEKLDRRAIQLGLKGKALEDYTTKYITNIQDITDFVHEQFSRLQKNGRNAILTPLEKVYTPSCSRTCLQIGLDFVAEQSLVSFVT